MKRSRHDAACIDIAKLQGVVPLDRSAWQSGIHESSVMEPSPCEEHVADDDTVNTDCSEETDADASLEFMSRESRRCSTTAIISTNNKRWQVLLLMRVLTAWLLLGKVCRLADSRDYIHRPRGNSLFALNGGALRAREFMRRAHSHNDYHQQDPLRSALQHGLTSIEVDVFPRKQELWVGHTVFELNATRTINNLYIEPLLELIKASRRAQSNYDRPFPQSRSMQQQRQQSTSFPRSSTVQQQQQKHLMNQETNALSLLVDFKGDAEKSVALLRDALAPLRPYLSRVDKNGQFQQGKITVLVSGNRPRDESLHERHSGERFLFVDGRARDLNANADSMLVPMVSIPWRHVHLARLVGRGEQYMSQLVRRAHSQGKLLRVWGAPNQEDLWRLMVRSKVDLLSIDDHGKFALFASTAALFR